MELADDMRLAKGRLQPHHFLCWPLISSNHQLPMVDRLAKKAQLRHMQQQMQQQQEERMAMRNCIGCGACIALRGPQSRNAFDRLDS